MVSIQAGLPEVEQVVAKTDTADYAFEALLKTVDINKLKQAEFDMLYKFDPKAEFWACRVCREKNRKDLESCTFCRAKRPDLDPEYNPKMTKK